jgi:hypothetical protein
MKAKNIIILMIFVLFNSCSKDFLDKKPLVNASAETYYSNEKEANTAIIGIYSNLKKEGFELAPLMLIGDDCSDDCNLGNSNSAAFSWLGPTAQTLVDSKTLANNSQSSALWSRAFIGITWATDLIEGIKDNVNIASGKKNQFLGEAHFLRAFYYFFLTRQYGRLPIVDHKLSYDEYFTPRASVKQTWEFIESELKTAAQLLPKKAEYLSSDIGRASKGAANTLLGKVFMYQSKFDSAYTILNQVVSSGEYGLEPNFADVFTLEKENGVESIFEIQHSISNTGWSDANSGSILSFYDADANPDDPIKWHSGWSMHCPTQDLVNSFEQGDPRLHATIIFKNEFFDGHTNPNAASTTGYQDKKWYVPYAQRSQLDQSDNPKNIIIMRYADVLLYLSEAANEIGKPSEALQYLEQVRGRARSNSTDPTVLPKVIETGKVALRQIIWHERRVELADEGQRFWDIVRQGRAGSIMRAYSNTYNTSKGKAFIDGVSEIFPIPAAQVTVSNGKMEQNPGY